MFMPKFEFGLDKFVTFFFDMKVQLGRVPSLTTKIRLHRN